MHFFISSNYWNTGVYFNLLMRNKSVGNIMKLIFEEVIVSDRHMSDGQL